MLHTTSTKHSQFLKYVVLYVHICITLFILLPYIASFCHCTDRNVPFPEVDTPTVDELLVLSRSAEMASNRLKFAAALEDLQKLALFCPIHCLLCLVASVVHLDRIVLAFILCSILFCLQTHVGVPTDQ